jgi:beta-mannosidase
MSWGVVDYLRQPKPGYLALARAFSPVLPIAYAHQKGSLRLHVANDRPNADNVLVTVFREVGGKPTYQRRIRLTLARNAVTIVDGAFSRPAPTETLRITVTDAKGALLGENSYAPGSFSE